MNQDRLHVIQNEEPIRNAVVESTLKVYRSIKKIDLMFHCLMGRSALQGIQFCHALAMKRGQFHTSSFGVLEVGKDEISGAAGERYTTLCSDVHPRGVENWIGASDDRFGVTLSTTRQLRIILIPQA
jgi:alpha-mannosidase